MYMGISLLRLEKFQEALEYTKESYKMFERLFQDSDRSEMALCLMNLGRSHLTLGNSKKAKKYIQKSYYMYKKLFKNIDRSEIIWGYHIWLHARSKKL